MKSSFENILLSVYMSPSLQLIHLPNLLLSVQHADNHMWAFTPHVFINRPKRDILAVKKDTGRAAEGAHK